MARGGLRRPSRRLPAERRVAEILSAARAILAEKGYDDTLMSDIAGRAGVVEGSLYRYFANKRDLLVKVVEHWYEDMIARDGSQLSAIRGLWNQIRFLVHHHLMTIRREPTLSRFVFQELRPEPGYRKTRLFHLNQTYAHRVVEAVEAAAARGELRPDVSASLVRDMIFGCIEHRTWAFLRNEGDFDADETADRITEMIYRGVALAQPHDALSRLEAVAERLETLPLLSKEADDQTGRAQGVLK